MNTKLGIGRLSGKEGVLNLKFHYLFHSKYVSSFLRFRKLFLSTVFLAIGPSGRHCRKGPKSTIFIPAEWWHNIRAETLCSS